MSTLAAVTQKGTRSAQPAATTCAVGTLYYVTDESVVERSNGTTWDAYSRVSVAEAQLSFTDITTNDASTTKHGLLKKLDNRPLSMMGGKGSWVAPSQRRQFMMAQTTTSALAAVDCYGLTFNTAGTGSQTQTQDSEGYWANFTSGATSGNAFRWQNNGVTIGRGDGLPTFYGRVRPGASIASCRMWFGLSDSNVMDTDTPTTGSIHFVGFRYSTVAGDTNWMACCEKGDGANGQRQSTGVAVQASTSARLAFQITSSSNVDFYVNDTLVVSCTSSTYIPFTTAWFPILYVITKENVAKTLSLSKIYVESE